MSEVANLGDRLNKELQQELLLNELRHEQIIADLGRVANIYSGQLPLSLLEDDLQDGTG
jgi:hypothetical protein